MSNQVATDAPDPKAARLTFGLIGATVAAFTAFGGILVGLVALLALLGTPLFAVMGGVSELAWLIDPDSDAAGAAPSRARGLRVALRRLAHPHDDPALHVRRLHDGRVEDARAPRARGDVVGRLAARRPRDRVRARERRVHALHGRQRRHDHRGRRPAPPGAPKQKGYSEKFALGLVTTGGSLGLLLAVRAPAPRLRDGDGPRLPARQQGGPRAGRARAPPVRRLLRLHRREGEDPAHALRREGGARGDVGLQVGARRLRPARRRHQDEHDGHRRGRRSRRALHARHRGLHLQGPHDQEGPRPHREGVDGARGRRHPHPRDGERAHLLRRRQEDPAAPHRGDAPPRARQDLAVPHRDERLPARARHDHGRLQRDPGRDPAHPPVRGALRARARSTSRSCSC